MLTGCEDDHKDCNFFAGSGDCIGGEYQGWMLINCKKSCGICQPYGKTIYLINMKEKLGLQHVRGDKLKVELIEQLPDKWTSHQTIH